MPELPEVEVLRRSLLPSLPGQTIERVQVRFPTLREPLDRRGLRRRLQGRRIDQLRRRSKYLLIDVEGGSTLAVHLGMSGRLLLTEGEVEPAPHEHVQFELASGRVLRYRDPRRFGLVFAVATATLEADRHFRDLGAEPLGPDFGGEFLARAAGRRSGPVKNFLMNAQVVVGVGNIYAAEALHRAGIHPLRSVARISAQRWGLLAEAVRHVLTKAIDEGGTTLNDFANGHGEAGLFQVSLEVYGRDGEECGRCGRCIRRVVLANRSTFYCPGCQR